jgi:hypothetical protein
MKRISICIFAGIVLVASIVIAKTNITEPRNGDCTREIVPIATQVNDSVLAYVKEVFENISIEDLMFSVSELAEIISKDTLYKDKWKEKANNYFSIYSDTLSYLTTNLELSLFYRTLEVRAKSEKKYKNVIQYLVENRIANPKRGIEKKEYAIFLGYYGTTDNSEGLSGLYYSLLMLDGQAFINAVKNKTALLVKFNKWLTDIEDYEFTTYSRPIQLIERRRNFIIDKYSGCKDNLMQKTLKVIKLAKIKVSE